MSTKSLANRLVYTLLRFAVIIYIFAAFYPYIVNPGFENTFGIWAVRWILILLVAFAALIFFIIGRTDFTRYGFFVVFIVAIFQIFASITKTFSVTTLLLHFYVIATAIYFITHDIRVNSGTSRHHKRSKEKTGKFNDKIQSNRY